MQAPLITLMTSSETTESYEVSFNVLSHIHLLVLRGANWVFESEYKQFFIKYDEPSYIKNLKLEILAQVASQSNIQEIVNELSEYVTDVNAEIARQSIACFSTIAIRLPEMSNNVASHLRTFLSLQISYVTNETLKALRDILRRYPSYIDDFLPFLTPKFMNEVYDVDGKIALCWLLGQFGEQIEDAPYMLEKMIEDLKELQSAELSNALLASAYKLFFKRAPETKRILAQIF
jgi:vesicle coat complex subunit